MSPRPIRCLLPVLLATALAACSDSGSSSGLERDVSPALQTALETMRADLARANWDPAGAATVRLYHDLRGAVRDPDRRAAVSDSFLAVWRRDPGQALWIELNTMEHGFLLHDARRREQLLAVAGPDTGSALHQFALARMFWGRRTIESRQRFLRADSLSGTVRDVSTAWMALRAARVLHDRGERSAGRTRLISLLPETLRLGGPSLAGQACRALVRQAEIDGRLADALAAARMAIECAGTNGDDYLLVRSIQSLGHVYLELRQTARADSIFAVSGRLARESGLLDRAALAHAYRAQVAEADGRLSDEIAWERKARDLALDVADTSRSLRATAALANALRRAGRLEDARAVLDAGDALDRSWSRSWSEKLDQARAALWMQLGRYAEAESLRVAIARKNRDRGDHGAWLEALTLLIRQGIETNDPALSYRALRRGEKLLAEHEIQADGNYDPMLQFSLEAARLHARQGEYHLADRWLRAAENRPGPGSPQAEWYLREARAQVAEQAGDLLSAAEHWRAGLALADRQEDPDLQRRSRVQWAAVRMKQGDADGALELVAADLHAPEYWNRLNATLISAMALRRLQRYEEATSDLERARLLLGDQAPADLAARVGLERGVTLAGQGRRAAALEVLLDVQDRLQRERNGPRTLFGETFNTRIERETAEALLRLLGRELDRREPAPDEIEQARRIAAWGRGDPPSDARGPRLEYFVGDGSAFVWTAGPDGDGFRWHALPGPARLEPLIASVQIDLGYPDRSIDEAALRRLGAVLLGPLRDAWPPDTTLEIVADGPLHGLPWWTLPLPGSGESGSRRAVQHGSIALVGGPARPQRDGSAAGRLLVIATDGYADGEGKGLHQAEAEARLVAGMWTAGPVRQILGSEASAPGWTVEQLAGYDVIHISSHTRIYEGAGGHSALHVAGGREPLTVPELADAKLRAGLVYLSSCDGGRRHRSAGLGVGSFAEAFRSAGAEQVIAAGVPVDDEAARAVAESFYRYWLDGKSRAEALRSALLEMSATGSPWAHPFYWSYYQLYRSAAR